MDRPRTIHDFGGFPRALYEVQYPASGSRWLAQETVNTVQSAAVSLDADWGLDHGAWSVLRQMFPGADVPVVQLSLDDTRPAQYHYDLGKELINENDHQSLVNYQALGGAAPLAVPTPEHYLPMLYALAVKDADEPVTIFNDVPLAGSLTMTSLLIGQRE